MNEFRLDGVRCPPRVCRIVTPPLLAALKAALDAYGTVDSEVAAWIRAVQLEGERDTGVRASEPNIGADESSQSTRDQLTTAELAAELVCTANNVRDLARRGRLTPTRRAPYLFARAEVDRYKSRRESA